MKAVENYIDPAGYSFSNILQTRIFYLFQFFILNLANLVSGIDKVKIHFPRTTHLFMHSLQDGKFKSLFMLSSPRYTRA